jgi:anaerobic magnesium-protoporphyrin IX monomethyl ester cyclase
MAEVLFVQEIYFPFQSTARLSAYLKQKGHKTGLVVGNEKKVIEAIKQKNPDLIAFSILTPYRNHMLSCAAAIKDAGIKIPIIAGGYDVTFLPEILESSDLDIICRGEGEEALSELCGRIDANEDYTDVPNLWVKKENEICRNRMRTWTMNMDALPFEDRDLYFDYDGYFKMIPFIQVLAGRGCPYLCHYCFNHGYSKIYENEGSLGYCKLRSVGNVMEELQLLKNKYKARYIFFNDSTLTYNKKWLLEFLSEYRKNIEIPFSINAVITEIDEDIGKALRDNRCCELIRFGLETGNEEYRFNVLNKRFTNTQLFKGVEILKRYNIRYSIAVMFGLPGESLDLAWETIKIAKQVSGRNSVHAVNIFKPFPGLDITEYGIHLGQYKETGISAKELPKVLQNRKAIGGKNKGRPKMSGLGAQDMCFYENYRIDEQGKLLVRLSRFSHLAIRFPLFRPLIKQLIKIPDNFIYRFVWKATEGLLNIRVHAKVPFSFFVKFYLFHSGKKIR